VSVIVHARGSARATLTTVRRSVTGAEDPSIETVVVDNALSASAALALAAGVIGVPGTRLVRLAQPVPFAAAANAGFAQATGDVVAFIQAGVVPRPGWLEPLRRRLGEADVIGVQPVLLRGDGTIHDAGSVFAMPGLTLPTPVFAGHPADDATALAGLDPDALAREFMAWRSADFAQLGGFDPVYRSDCETIDLSLRARAALPDGRFAIAQDATAALPLRARGGAKGGPASSTGVDADRETLMERWSDRLPAPRPEAWRRGGFHVVAMGTDGALYPRPRPVVARREGMSLRWGVLNPASASEVGDTWGDTAFVEALVRGVRATGAVAVAFRRHARNAPARALDDVALTVRGLVAGSPLPGAINILWVISRPAEVTPAEVRQFDLVYAASPAWARAMSARAGVEVRTLLQATDPAVFGPGGSAGGERRNRRGGGVVFVGQARRGGPRRIVMDAIAAGLTPQVWGPRWGAHIPAELHRGDHIRNGDLAALYRGADIVLADHWPDMAREGFISNRLFDAVACGARVISDSVDGIGALFRGAVQCYHDAADLAALASPTGRAQSFPDTPTRAAIARQIARDHSFDARARQLAADVEALRAERE
jgi:hypothetical protein